MSDLAYLEPSICAVLYYRVHRHKVCQCLHLDFETEWSDGESETSNDEDV